MSLAKAGVIGSKGRRRRSLLVCAALVAIGLVAFVSLDFAWYSEERAPYSPPRTPWGDPDIQGAFTNTTERGIPMERPEPEGWFRTVSKGLGFDRPRPPRKSRHNDWEPIYEEPPDHSRAWLIVDPPDGKIPPMTPEASRRRAEQAQSHQRDVAPWVPMGLLVRCISRGMPHSMMPTFYGNVYDITQAPGVVAIRYEMINETRIIPLDGRPHVGSGIRSYMGDARGHFDGDTLSVETTNLTDKTPFRGSSERLRLVERFTPVAADAVEWSVTVDDPATWSKPWTFAMRLTRTTQRPMEYSCHEGNYALRNILTIPASTPGE